MNIHSEHLAMPPCDHDECGLTKCNRMTDIELKLALAKKLPELIHISVIPYKENYEPWTHFYWKQPIEGAQITPREWDWVVREVEKQITAIEFLKFWSALCRVVWGTPISMESNTRLVREATWQQRAQALKEIGVI